MIVFDLDGTLACCEHRRHFVDPGKLTKWEHSVEGDYYTDGLHGSKVNWKPDWKAFYEACDQDKPIKPLIEMFRLISVQYDTVEIWSGRCESVREKTLDWLIDNMKSGIDEREYFNLILKMRPIGDSIPDDQLKERWLDEYIQKSCNDAVTGKTDSHKGSNGIDFCFDNRPKVTRMFRRRGIFVFNCAQHNEEI